MHGHTQRDSKEHIRWRYTGQAPLQEVRRLLSYLGVVSPSSTHTGTLYHISQEPFTLLGLKKHFIHFDEHIFNEQIQTY